MTIFTKISKAAHSVVLGTIMVLSLTAPSKALDLVVVAPAGFEAIQTFSVNSTKGQSFMHQFIRHDTVHTTRTRVCLKNMSATPKVFTHAVVGVKPLYAAPFGGRDCALFNAADRVAFGLVDDGEPAQPSKAMVMSLSAFKGGTVGFVWQ